MELALTTATGKASKKTVEVSDVNFGADFNESLVHQAVVAYLAGARSGTRAQKSRTVPPCARFCQNWFARSACW